MPANIIAFHVRSCIPSSLCDVSSLREILRASDLLRLLLELLDLVFRRLARLAAIRFDLLCTR